MFEHGLEKNVPVQTLNVLDEAVHEHAINHDKNKEVLEHHQKDENGKVIEHEEEDTTPSSVEEDTVKEGGWAAVGKAALAGARAGAIDGAIGGAMGAVAAKAKKKPKKESFTFKAFRSVTEKK